VRGRKKLQTPTPGSFSFGIGLTGLNSIEPADSRNENENENTHMTDPALPGVFETRRSTPGLAVLYRLTV